VKLSAVIFDYGMVLSGPPNLDLKAEIVRRSGIPSAQAEALYWKYRPAYDRGDLDGPAYWQTILEEGGVPSPPELVRELTELDARMWTGTNQPLVDWQARLRAAGVKTAVLSNLGDWVKEHVLRDLPWFSAFDVRVFSCDLHLAKPDPAIYRHALEQLGTEPDDTVFIDDLAHNVEGAQALGIHGIQYTGMQELRQAIRALNLVGIPQPE
jgi:putative hydrolase of the HAD superfamily